MTILYTVMSVFFIMYASYLRIETGSAGMFVLPAIASMLYLFALFFSKKIKKT